MRAHNFSLVCFFCLILLPFNAVSVNTLNESKIICERDITSETINYSISSPYIIEVNSDSDFVNLGFEGNGTEVSPYIIEDLQLEIDDDWNGIRVKQTTKHFVIRNCTINSLEIVTHAISIVDVADNTAIIENCIVYSGEYYGISISDSPGSIVRNCTIYDGTLSSGISENILFENNYVKNGNINVRVTNGVTLINNSVDKGRFTLSYNLGANYSTVNIVSNRINSKEMGFFAESKNLIIDSTYGRLDLIYCLNIQIKNLNFSHIDSGVTLTYCFNVQVENCTFQRNTFSLRIKDCRDVTITKCKIDHNSHGIYLGYCQRSTISDNIINSQYNNGMAIVTSQNTTVSNNQIIGNTLKGIHLQGYSTEMLIVNNSINQNDVGLQIEGVLNSQFLNNTCKGNIQYGFLIMNSTSTNYMFNTVLDNGFIGMYFFCLYSFAPYHYNSIIYNNISLNENYGLSIQGRYNDYMMGYEGFINSTIHHNIFIDNNLEGTSQAKDTAYNNSWYDPITLEGNFWSDLGNKAQYLIDGGAIDLYPLNRVEIVTTIISYEIAYFILLSTITLHVIVRRKKRRKSIYTKP
ncbi:MAG: hypothetical protein GPJ51_02625 [Candidatus Heimdallarchaeota archaeon]|nr:hypothetical protein [Candidatus Heimdallarchaeota archaeon]